MTNRLHRSAVRRATSRHRYARLALEALEPRTLFSVSYAAADMSGTWSYAAMGAAGTIQFDAANAVTGGSLNKADGTNAVPSGSYAINASGILSVSTASATKSGAMDSSKDLLAMAVTGKGDASGNSLSVLMKSTATIFSNADLNGSWSLYVNGDASDNTGVGTIAFDGNGNITGGSNTDAHGSVTITGGTYSVSSSGQVLANINVLESDGFTTGSSQISGQFNAAKDTLAFNPQNFPAAASNNESRLILLIHSTGTFSNADLSNTWSFVGDGYNGSLAFDGAGNITAGSGVNEQGGAFAATGTYAVATDGAFTAAVHFSQSNGTKDAAFQGSLAAGKNVAAMEKTPFDNGTHSSQDSLIVLLNSAAAPVTTRALGGTWTYAAVDQNGDIQFNIANNITGGSVVDTSGGTTTLSGTYTNASTGAFSMITPGGTRAGAINSTGDVLAATQSNSDSTLTVLVSGGVTTFTNADLSGTWNLQFNGPTTQSNGSGTLSFDGQGNVSEGTFTTGNSESSITGGSYIVNADGTCTVSLDLTTPGGPTTFNYTGALNASRDFLALDPDLQSAAATSSPNLTFLVRSKGTYSNADVKGAWVLETEGGWASLTLDGAGHISGGTFVGSDGSISTVGGTYAVAASGAYTANVAATHNGVTQHFIQKGAVNASRNIMIQNQNSTSGGDNLSILIKSAAGIPTLSAVVPFFTAAAGQPFTITYAQLADHANAIVSNGQPLQFQITALTAGTLGVNSTPQTVFPVTIGPGDTLTWTSAATASGPIAAFSIKAFDGSTLSTTAAAVTVNTIIPEPYTLASLSNSWNLEGTNSAGNVIFNGAGSITGGSITDDSGQTDTAEGTYAIDPTGALSISAGDSLTGAINAAQDVAAVSGDGHLTVLLNSQNANFSTSDLTGVWTLAINGDTIDGNGLGTMTFDGAGNISSGNFTSGAGSQALAGTYILNADGSLTLNVVTVKTGGQLKTLTLTGFMNNAKDVVALNHPDLLAAANTSESNLIMLVHAAGTYSNADAKGTWTIAGDGASGSITFDGAGHLVNGVLNDKGKIRILGGSYSVAANGAWTFNVTATYQGVTQSQSFKGSLNKSRNIIAMNFASSNPDNTDNLTILINSANHAPTLTSVTPFATAIAGHDFPIAFADLAAAGNEADIDGDPLSFNIMSVAAGSTLTLNGTPVTTFPTTVTTGDNLIWTPTAASKGNIAAFTIKATDGTLVSATAVPVTVKTVLTPTISLAVTKSAASEIKNAPGVFTLSRANGILDQELTVTVVITGTADNGTDYSTLATEVHFNASQTSVPVSFVPVSDLHAEGPENVIITVVASDLGQIYNPSGTKAAGTITIADAASTISASVSKATASEINGTSSGSGQFTILRSGGDQSVSQDVVFTLTGNAAVGTNYLVANSTSVTFDALSGTGTITIAASKPSAVLTINPLNDHVANSTSSPNSVILTITADANPSYFINGAKNPATIAKIADAAGTISIAASKSAASEISGTTTGAGTFTFTRTGGDMSISQNVLFTVTGSATPTTDYLLANSTSVFFDSVSGHGTITLAAGKSSGTLTINPVDDIVAEGAETVIVTPTADASYFITNNTKNTSATVTIADDTRPLIAGPVMTLGDAHNGVPFAITFDDLVAATHAQARSGSIIFRITKVTTGNLKKSGLNVVAGTTTLATGESLTYTAATTGTLSAFNVIAINGTSLSSTLTIPIHVLA